MPVPYRQQAAQTTCHLLAAQQEPHTQTKKKKKKAQLLMKEVWKFSGKKERKERIYVTRLKEQED